MVAGRGARPSCHPAVTWWTMVNVIIHEKYCPLYDLVNYDNVIIYKKYTVWSSELWQSYHTREIHCMTWWTMPMLSYRWRTVHCMTWWIMAMLPLLYDNTGWILLAIVYQVMQCILLLYDNVAIVHSTRTCTEWPGELWQCYHTQEVHCTTRWTMAMLFVSTPYDLANYGNVHTREVYCKTWNTTTVIHEKKRVWSGEVHYVNYHKREVHCIAWLLR